MKQPFTQNVVKASAVILVAATLTAAPVQARDFFSSFMTAFTGSNSHSPEPSTALPFTTEGDPNAQSNQPKFSQSASAYCVRTCDGRYFPISGSGGESRTKTCNSLCPASETKVVYGSNIDSAATDNGKPYSELPNAFRYRNEIVAGCTCNGKDQIGLAPVKIENDPTLRKGDIVAGENGLLVAGRSADRRGASLNFSPASDRVQSKYQRGPVVAQE